MSNGERDYIAEAIETARQDRGVSLDQGEERTAEVLRDLDNDDLGDIEDTLPTTTPWNSDDDDD